MITVTIFSESDINFGFDTLTDPPQLRARLG
jgi:hypothetical protein